MITQDPQTFAITGPDPTDPQHRIVTVSTNDPRFYLLYGIMVQQQQVGSENQKTHDAYIGALSLYQKDADIGRPDAGPPPVKPLMKTIDDYGVSHMVDFVPPLPDFHPPAAPLPNMPGGVDPSTRPPDTLSVLMAQGQMLAQILQLLMALKTKVGA